MRIGVVSDIHGNCVALDAVLADVATHPVDRFVCLGDALQGGCQPREVVERLQELGCPVVLGNADAFLLDAAVGETDAAGTEREEQLQRVRAWTVDALGAGGLDVVRTFLPTVELDLGEAGGLLCFHGTPSSYDEVLLPETPTEQIASALGGHTGPTFCGGHTHLQWTVRIGERMFFNPGSVGLGYNRHLPRDEFHFDAFAAYAILSTLGPDVRLEFKRVPFDVDALDRTARASDHPEGETLAARYRPPV
jgi:predicted phosphodiesterase